MLADLDAVSLTRYPPGLCDAFKKAEARGTAVPECSWGAAHLWIFDPLSEVGRGPRRTGSTSCSATTSTLPPAPDRPAGRALRSLRPLRTLRPSSSRPSLRVIAAGCSGDDSASAKKTTTTAPKDGATTDETTTTTALPLAWAPPAAPGDAVTGVDQPAIEPHR